MGQGSQQVIAEKINDARREQQQAYAGYRRGEGTDRINAADRRLANLAQELYCDAANVDRSCNER